MKEYVCVIVECDLEVGWNCVVEIFEMEWRWWEEGGKNGFDKYWSEKKFENMWERDWCIFKEDFNIVIKGGSIFNLMCLWKEFNLFKCLFDIVDEVGYKDLLVV